MDRMLHTISGYVRRVASETGQDYWRQKFKQDYGLGISVQEGVTDVDLILQECHRILSLMPIELIKDCGVNELELKSDMGRSLQCTPNHGFYIANKVALNYDIFIHSDNLEDPMTPQGYPLSREKYTLIHEFGHGFDEKQGYLSEKPEWLRLSGWSAIDMPYLKRLVIRSPGRPDKKGEWFYHPNAKFCRFYGKQNPWDDWADTFCFYINNIKDNIPQAKNEYIESLLSKYYS